jgi:hypothetical protein
MTRENIEELARAQAPQINIIRVHRSSCYDITAGLYGQACELSWLVCLHRSEVAVLDKIIGSHCAIKTSTQNRVPLLRCELKSRNLGCMLRKGHETKRIFDSPQFNLAIVSSCCNHGPIRRVSNRVEVKEVSLLFQDIRLALPLPHKELTLLFTSHGNPVGLSIDSNAIDLVLRDLERVNRLKGVEVIQAEHTIRLTYHEDHFTGVCLILCSSMAMRDGTSDNFAHSLKLEF